MTIFINSLDWKNINKSNKSLCILKKKIQKKEKSNDNKNEYHTPKKRKK